MLKKLLLGFAFCIQSTMIFCQYPTNYEPISYKGSVPAEFLFIPTESVTKSITEQNILDPETARIFFNSIYFEKKELFLNGDIYFNDELTAYVRAVADKLTQNNPSLKKGINIYITRYCTPNAVAYPDGTILINVGLIALLENEAQLAFVIAHEIAHFELKHGIKTVAKLVEIKKQQINTNNSEGNIFRKLKYSRENEFESDAKAIEYLLLSDYNAFESCKMIQHFNDSSYLKFSSKIDYSKWFGNKIATDTNLFKQKSKNKTKNTDIVLGRDDYDDMFESHPDDQKRIEAIKAILQISDYSDKGKIIISSTKQDFDKIKSTAVFEVVNNFYRKSDFSNSFYLTLKLLNQYPDNSFLLVKLIENIYWMSFYKDIKCLSEVVTKEPEINNKDYDSLNCFLNNVGLKEIKELTYNVSKGLSEKMVKNDELFFYYILASERYLGKETAKFLYIKYKVQFPAGKYISLVENKLN